MKIVIQTYKRVGDQVSLDRMPVDIGKHEILFCCPESEWPDHQGYDYSKKVTPFTHSDDLKGLSLKRQWIADQAQKKGWDKFCLMDDDLTLYERISETDWHLRYIKDHRVAEMFDLMEEWLDDFAIVGVSSREGNNHNIVGWDIACRMCRLFAFRTDTFTNNPDLKFRELSGMEDFGIIMELITKGWPNFVSFHFANGQKASNTSGGCAEWRTYETQEAASKWMAKTYPRWVKAVEKKVKQGGWKGMETRVDVTIQWKKALRESGWGLPDPPKRLR